MGASLLAVAKSIYYGGLILKWSHFTIAIPSSPFGNRGFSQGPGNNLFNQYCPSEG